MVSKEISTCTKTLILEIFEELVTGPLRAICVVWLRAVSIMRVTAASVTVWSIFRSTIADFQEGTMNLPHIEVFPVLVQLDNFFKANVFL